MSTLTKPMTATEILALQDRENQSIREAFQRIVAKGLADAVDDKILEILMPQFGEGIYDYDD